MDALQLKKELKSLYENGFRRHGMTTVWRDSMAMFAISMLNDYFVDGRDKREQEYLRIHSKYDSYELDSFFRILTLMLIHGDCQTDLLGELFMDLGLGNKNRGQFFTPFHLSLAMAEMVVQDIPEKDEITILDPACGAGSMLIAACHVARKKGISQDKLALTAIDIDETCVHMCFLQMTFIGVRAVVYHGNSLSHEIWSSWPTLGKKYVR